MADVLDSIERAAIPWGIVTNKPRHLTEPLLDRLDLTRRCSAIVSGDSLPERKPHPAPLLHAMSVIGLEPRVSVYVGDAERDIAAGRAAGMSTISAAWGYIPPDDDPGAWGADHVLEEPGDLLSWLESGWSGDTAGG